MNHIGLGVLLRLGSRVPSLPLNYSYKPLTLLGLQLSLCFSWQRCELYWVANYFKSVYLLINTDWFYNSVPLPKSQKFPFLLPKQATSWRLAVSLWIRKALQQPQALIISKNPKYRHHPAVSETRQNWYQCLISNLTIQMKTNYRKYVAIPRVETAIPVSSNALCKIFSKVSRKRR